MGTIGGPYTAKVSLPVSYSRPFLCASPNTAQSNRFTSWVDHIGDKSWQDASRNQDPVSVLECISVPFVSR